MDESRRLNADRYPPSLKDVTAQSWRARRRSTCLVQFPLRRPQATNKLDLNWLALAVASNRAKSSTDTIKTVIAGLNALLKERRFKLLSHIFSLIPVSMISPEIMVALLRTTAAVNELIPAWSSLLMRVRVELDARGLPSKKILIGLI